MRKKRESGIEWFLKQQESKSKQIPELSDEEIDKEAIRYDKSAITDTPWMHFTEGAKWYREQLKQR